MKPYRQILTLLATLLSVAGVSSSGVAQTIPLKAPMTMTAAQTMLGLQAGSYELVSAITKSSDGLSTAKDICGESDFTPGWTGSESPRLAWIQTGFTDFNRGTVIENSDEIKGGVICINKFTTTLAAHQLISTSIENANCPADYNRLDENITVSGDILLYNYNKVWADKKTKPLTVQCVFKLKK